MHSNRMAIRAINGVAASGVAAIAAQAHTHTDALRYMVIGLLQPDGTTLRLVVDAPLRTASTLGGCISDGHARSPYKRKAP
jgi:hypothetical protein